MTKKKRLRHTPKPKAVEKISQPTTDDAFKLEMTPVTKEPTKLQTWLKQAPIATTGVPELRWYGETFLPAYTQWLAEGRKLIG